MCDFECVHPVALKVEPVNGDTVVYVNREGIHTTISPAAERRLRFARAKVEGEERRQAEEVEENRLQRLEELRERAIKDLAPDPVRKAREKAEKALSAYVKACVAYNARLEEIAGELELLGPLPADFVVDRSYSGHVHVTVGGGPHASQLRPMVEVSRIAHEKLREHIPRGYVDLEKPY